MHEAVSILWALPTGNGSVHDPLGTAFDVFLRRRYDNSGGLGTFLTPGTVVDLMVEVGFDILLRDEDRTTEFGLMGDPCCGSGRFLIGLRQAAHQHLGDRCEDTDSLIFGADQSPSSIAMARVNLLASGMDRPHVFAVSDSITSAWISDTCGRFSLILTNPPFGSAKYDSSEGIHLAVEYFPRLSGSERIDPALAFVARCLELLAPRGVLGIILPDGLINGRAMRDLLYGPQRLDLSIGVEGVISLPSATFAPAGTTAKTSVLFLRKQLREEQKPIFLARADHVGYVMSKGSPVADKYGDDLPQIGQEIGTYLRSGDHNLAGKRYLTLEKLDDLSSLDASIVDSDARQARDSLLRAGGITAREVLEFTGKTRSRLVDNQVFISVLHIDHLGSIDWPAAVKHHPSTPGQVALPGQIIISQLNPRKFRAAVIPLGCSPVQCSIEFGVFQPKIDPYAALILLQHPLVRRQVAPLGRGTSSSRRRIDADDILTLILPAFDEAWSNHTGTIVRQDFESIDAARQNLDSFCSGRNSLIADIS